MMMSLDSGVTVFWWEDDFLHSGVVLEVNGKSVTVRAIEPDTVVRFFNWQGDGLSACKADVLEVAKQDILGRIEELESLAELNGITLY